MDRNSQATWDIPSFPLFSGLPTPDTDRQTDTTKNQIKYSTKITFSALLRLQNSSFFQHPQHICKELYPQEKPKGRGHPSVCFNSQCGLAWKPPIQPQNTLAKFRHFRVQVNWFKRSNSKTSHSESKTNLETTKRDLIKEYGISADSRPSVKEWRCHSDYCHDLMCLSYRPYGVSS